MQIQSDHKALIFLGAVAVLGAGVRVVRAASANRPAVQPALEHQMSAADSAARANEQRQARGPQRGRGAKRGITTGRGSPPDTSRTRPSAIGALDRQGYIGGKLDLDVATAAQIDSLPGISPSMARRIVSDRMRRGPFLSAQGMRRVSGVGENFLRQIDTLVTFSGTLKQSPGSDSLIERTPKQRSSRSTKTRRPAALQTAGPQRGPSLRATADSYSRARERSAWLQPAT
jgi:helix-hairpin-helix protein